MMSAETLTLGSLLRRVLALFTVGDVCVSLCKRGAYAPYSSQPNVTNAILAVI